MKVEAKAKQVRAPNTSRFPGFRPIRRQSYESLGFSNASNSREGAHLSSKPSASSQPSKDSDTRVLSDLLEDSHSKARSKGVPDLSASPHLISKAVACLFLSLSSHVTQSQFCKGAARVQRSHLLPLPYRQPMPKATLTRTLSPAKKIRSNYMIYLKLPGALPRLPRKAFRRAQLRQKAVCHHALNHLLHRSQLYGPLKNGDRKVLQGFRRTHQLTVPTSKSKPMTVRPKLP